MSARMRLLMLSVALTTATMLAWTAFGSITVARAQKSGRISRAHEGDRAPSFDKAIYILVLGSDAHRGNPDQGRFDSIHVLGIDPKTRRAGLVGIPRDTYVRIAGGGMNKITSAGTGGARRMVETVEQNWGCRFDYFMLTAFDGFRKLTRELGGITIDVPTRMYEECCSKIDLHPGVQKLAGQQALAYARNRKVARPGGDLDRSQAQGDLMVGALRDARTKLQRDVTVPVRSLALLRRYVKMDIPLAEAFKLGLLALRVDPKNVLNTVADGNPATENGSSIVRLTEQGQRTLFNVCAGKF